jgi:hypothetical protein
MSQSSVWLGAGLVIGAYLLGSICFGVVLASRRGIDLRSVGSGNVGATNAGRALGRSAGRLVMLLDALKGLLPAVAARALLRSDDPWTAATGLAAAIGDLARLPRWQRGRDGRRRPARRRAGRRGRRGGHVCGAEGVDPARERRLGRGRARRRRRHRGALARHAGNIGRLFRGEEPPS